MTTKRGFSVIFSSSLIKFCQKNAQQKPQKELKTRKFNQKTFGKLNFSHNTFYSSKKHNYQTVRARDLRILDIVYHSLCVICYVSRVMYHVSYVTCHILCVSCHVSYQVLVVTYHVLKKKYISTGPTLSSFYLCPVGQGCKVWIRSIL